MNNTHPLHQVAREGDLEKIDALLKLNPGLVFSKDDHGLGLGEDKGETALHVAAEAGHEGIAELLLAHGAEINVRDPSGITPLHRAASMGHEEVAELLLAHGADVNGLDMEVRTPLHAASYGGHRHVAELLLSRGAWVSVTNTLGHTPLHIAIVHRHYASTELRHRLYSVAELLLAHGIDLSIRDDTFGATALQTAVRYGDGEMAALLLAHGATRERQVT